MWSKPVITVFNLEDIVTYGSNSYACDRPTCGC
jgi:hypothetical protein